MNLTPQARTVLKHLVKEGSITPMVAAGIYKVRSLPRRILDLKEQGIQVERVLCKDATGQRYASYSMPTKERIKLMPQFA